jgi:hypothetical protein
MKGQQQNKKKKKEAHDSQIQKKSLFEKLCGCCKKRDVAQQDLEEDTQDAEAAKEEAAAKAQEENTASMEEESRALALAGEKEAQEMEVDENRLAELDEICGELSGKMVLVACPNPLCHPLAKQASTTNKRGPKVVYRTEYQCPVELLGEAVTCSRCDVRFLAGTNEPLGAISFDEKGHTTIRCECPNMNCASRTGPDGIVSFSVSASMVGKPVTCTSCGAKWDVRCPIAQKNDLTEPEDISQPDRTHKQVMKIHQQMMKAATTTVSDQSMKMLLAFFFSLVMFSFVALAFNMLGLVMPLMRSNNYEPTYLLTAIQAKADSEGIPVQSFYEKEEFVFWNNWKDFADNCCCYEMKMYGQTVRKEGEPGAEVYAQAEMWQCKIPEQKISEAGGAATEFGSSVYMIKSFKQRLRVLQDENGAIHNGTLVRPICSREFSGNFEPLWFETKDSYGVKINYNASATVAEYLW